MKGITSAGEEERMCLRGSVERKTTMFTIMQSIKYTRLCLCVGEQEEHVQ